MSSESGYEIADFAGPSIEIPGPGGSDEYPVAAAARIASHFSLETPVEAYDFPEKGNINQKTYLVTGGSATPREFILQQINQEVFTRPESVMAAMLSCIEAQNSGLKTIELPPGTRWEAIQLVPTRQGRPFLRFQNRRGKTIWRLMHKIQGCRTFKSLGELPGRTEQLRIAEEAGRGLAVYCDLTSDMNTEGLENPLPGYRETHVYFSQLKSVLDGCQTVDDAHPFLPEDEVIRQSTQEHFRLHIPRKEYERRRDDDQVQKVVALALENEEFGTSLLRWMKSGEIRRVAIHGDTKLDNFLFDEETSRVRALVDLDTIMPHTWLADWGDMARSLTNVAGEKEKDLSSVDVDMEIYESLAKGFLATTTRLPENEIRLMPEAVEIIALELGLRFLTDYLRGDSYFKLSASDPPDLNRTRGLVQLRLFEILRERRSQTERCIKKWKP